MHELVNTREQIQEREKLIGIKPSLKRLIPYVGVLVLTLLVLEVVFKLYKVDLLIPFCYGRDNLWDLQVMKGEINKEWSLLSWVPKSPYVGAPFGQSLYDFPGWADAGQIFLFVKLLSFFTKNVFLISNGFTLFTYFSTALTALFAFRWYRIPYGIAIPFSILFNFIPYHMLRIVYGHPLLSSIYEIPLMGLIILWIGSAKPIFFKRVEGRYRLDFKNRKAIITIVVALLSSLSNIYYIFFFGSLAMVAGVRAAVQRKSWHHLLVPVIIMMFVACAETVIVSPYLFYRSNQGINSEAGLRSHVDSEIFGLKIAQMLLPVDGHRLPILANLKNRYNAHPLINENASATLGLIGSAGFLFLLFHLLLAGKSMKTTYNKLALLSLAATLIGTIGGFATVMSVLGFAYFRCNNRLSLFIGFYSLMALAFLVNRYKRHVPRWALYGGLVVITVVGLYDQNPPLGAFSYGYSNKREEFLSDQQFVRAIEKTAPKGVLIFQLPYMGFPEGPSPDGIYFYEHFKGYLQASSELYWSFGSVRGTYGGQWYELTANLPLDKMLYELSVRGFSGIYIDRQGYKDRADSLETSLREFIQKPPLVSPNDRLVYYDISAHRDELLKGIDAAKREYLRYPTQDDWYNGFYRIEWNAENRWHWCGNKGELWLTNPSAKERRERMYMEFHPVHEEPFEVIIEGDGFSDRIRVDGQVENYEREVRIPANGRVIFRFHSNAKPLSVPDDARPLAFAVYNFELKNLDIAMGN